MVKNTKKAMYEKFYYFSEAPFGLSPDPRFLYMAPSHFEAYSAMLSGIRERKGITIITGPPGIGKTTLAYALLNDLDEKIKSSFIYFTNVTFEQLLRKILLDLGIPEEDADLFGHMQKFFQYLSDRLAHNETVAIVIDEAQGLKATVLNDLLRLSTRPQASSKILQLILIGQPEFERTLDSKELQDLRDKTSVRRQIRPLNREESKAYVDYRLKMVGSASMSIFTPDALSLICELGGGIPRLINMVCDTALAIGYSNSAPTIDGKTVKKAAGDLGHLSLGGAPEPRRARPAAKLEKSDRPNRLLRPWYAILGAAILAVLVVVFLGPWSRQEVPHRKEPLQPTPGQEERKEASVPMKPTPGQEERKEASVPTKVIARKGSTLTSLSEESYGVANPTILDRILEANPEITDVDRIEVNQEITIPPISEEMFLIKSPDGSFKIHIETSKDTRVARLLKNESALGGKKVEFAPRRVSPRQTWYRILAGPFSTKEEGLDTIRSLEKKGLMPGLASRTR